MTRILKSKYKVLIVENSNNTDFKNKVEKRFSNVECILAGENLGYAKGNNLGLTMVNTKYALIINPDAEVQNKAIDNFFLTAKNKPNFAIIAPFIQEKNDKDLRKDINKGVKSVPKKIDKLLSPT